MQKVKKTPYTRIQSILFSLSAILIITILIFFATDSETNKRNLDYISSLNWEVDEKPCDISYLCIPTEFDAVFSAYNEIVKSGGFDLIPYKGEHIVRYSYKVKNHPDSSSDLIRINILIYKDKIISADLSSLAPNGFIMPLTANDILTQL